jgi:hypothetical protein
MAAMQYLIYESSCSNFPQPPHSRTIWPIDTLLQHACVQRIRYVADFTARGKCKLSFDRRDRLVPAHCAPWAGEEL